MLKARMVPVFRPSVLFAFQPVEDKPEPVQQYVARDEFDAAMKHLREAIDNGE